MKSRKFQNLKDDNCKVVLCDQISHVEGIMNILTGVLVNLKVVYLSIKWHGATTISTAALQKLSIGVQMHDNFKGFSMILN